MNVHSSPAGELAAASERFSETVPPGDTTPEDRVRESVWPKAMVLDSENSITAIVLFDKLRTMALSKRSFRQRPSNIGEDR